MIPFPVAERELRVAARRGRMHWERTIFAFCALLVLAWLLLTFGRWGNLAEQARIAFYGLSTIAMVFGGFSGVVLTADCVSEERREGTLGLLFLTDLKSRDIVLGKLTATALGAFLSLLTLVPILMLPLLMGGVTPGESLRMALLLGVFTFCSLGLGLACSVLFTNSKAARSVTFIGMILIAAGGPIAFALVGFRDSFNTPPPDFLLHLGSAFCLSIVGDVAFRSHVLLYWGHILALLAGGFASLVAAAWMLPRAWQDRHASASGEKRARKVEEWHTGGGSLRMLERGRLLEENPILWLASRGRFRPVWVYGLLGLLASAVVWCVFEFGQDFFEGGGGLIFWLVMGTNLFKWLLGAFAGKVLENDFRNGSIELIVSTPLTVDEIISGHMRALRRLFLGPSLMFVFLAATALSFSARDHTDGVEQALFGMGQLVMFAADMVALAWLGLWMAVQGKKPGRAAGSTVFRILILPGILMLLAAPFTSGWSGESAALVWFGICIVNDIVHTLSSMEKLKHQFRDRAMMRFQPSSAR